MSAGGPVRRMVIGHTLPAGSAVASVQLDGAPVAYEQRETNRGLEVTVPTTPGRHVLVVTAG